MQVSWGNSLAVSNVGKLVLLVTLAHTLGVSMAGYDHTCSVLSRPHRYGRCGRILADTVEMVCKTYSRFLVKRDVGKERVNEKVRDIFLNKEKALSYLTKREARGSIVCECCFNTCTFTELLEYCDFSSYTRTSSSYRNVNK